MTGSRKTNAVWARIGSFFSSDLKKIKTLSWAPKIIVALDTVPTALAGKSARLRGRSGQQSSLSTTIMAQPLHKAMHFFMPRVFVAKTQPGLLFLLLLSPSKSKKNVIHSAGQ